MKLRTQLAAGLGMSLLPLVAQAQSAIIVVSPNGQPAPALSTMMLLVLVVALSAGAIVLLRRTRFGGAAQAAVLLVAAAMAGIGYATPPVTIVIDGDECGRTTQHPYNPGQSNPGTLENDCSSALRIVSIDFDCDNDNEGLGGGASESRIVCEEDLVLSPGQSCTLPAACNT